MIRLRDIHKEYQNGTKALKGVSMQIDDGDFVFLVGPSGSGKSTIIKLITAEISPTRGKLMVNGYNLNDISEKQIPLMRRTIGVVFQDFRLIEKKTVYENIEVAMRAVGATTYEIRRRIPYVLDLVGLTNKGGRLRTQLPRVLRRAEGHNRSMLSPPLLAQAGSRLAQAFVIVGMKWHDASPLFFRHSRIIPGGKARRKTFCETNTQKHRPTLMDGRVLGKISQKNFGVIRRLKHPL